MWLRVILIGLLVASGTIVGTPGSAQTTTVNYYLPYTAGFTATLNQGNNTGPNGSHTGTNAWAYDFGLNGGAVRASAPGTIVGKVTNQTGQTGPGNSGNYIVLKHADNTCTTYAHMAYGSVTTKNVGDSVAQAEYVGNEGNTGYTLPAGGGHHLHFQRDNCSWNSTPVDFVENDWTSQNSSGGNSQGLRAPSAITDPSTGRNIFYVGADNYIWQWSIQNGQWTNVKLTTPSGGQAVAPNTSPTAIYDPTSGRNVFYVGADKAIWQWSVQNGQWTNFRLGGSVASDSSPSAVLDPATGRNIFYVGANGAINQWSIQSGQWTNVSLGGTALGGTSPSAVVDPTTGRNVFYVGLDSKISQWSVQNGQWTNVALNGAGGNKTVASHSSPSAVMDPATGRNVFYVGSDSFVYQWSVQNGQWTNFALTGTGGNEPAAQYSSPSAVVDSSTGRNIFYVGANNRIYQWSIQNGAWNNFMLTGAGGNATADSNTGPGAIVDTSTGTGRNVFYFNTGRVYQWSIQNGQWTNFQLQ